MRHRINSLQQIGLIFLLCGLGRVAFATDLSVSPSYLEWEKELGTTVQENITIYNPSASAMRAKLYVGDFWYDAKGGRTFPNPGTSPHSAAGWVGIAEPEVEVPAKGTKITTISFTIPADAPASAYATVFVERTTDRKEGGAGKTQGSVAIALRIAVPILFQRKGADLKKVELQEFTLAKPSEFKPLLLRFLLENQERSYVFPEGAVTVVKKETKQFVAKAELKRERVLLPSQRSLFEVPVAMEPKVGHYEGLVTVFFGNNQSRTQTFEFAIP